MERSSGAGGSRTLRLLVALLGVLGLVALAPQFARAVTVNGAISGQVTDSVTGSGVSGVTVNLWNGSTEIGQTQTGVNGDYNLGSWPSQIGYTVQFVDAAAGYGNLWYNGQPNQTDATVVTVDGPPPYVTVNQALTPDQVTGQLTDQATGKALSGVEVELLSGPSGASTEVAHTTTDANGDYSFSAIPPGTGYYVEFNPLGADAGYNTTYYGGASPTAFSVSAGGTTSGIDGQIQADQVTGRLTEQATGQALSGIEVELLSGPDTEVAQTTTDGNGEYSFSAIPPGTYYVEFNPDVATSNYYSSYYGGATPTGFSVTAGQTTSGINGQLFTGGLISGTVTGAAQQGVSGVEVQLMDVNTGDYYYATTGSNGTYALDGLPTGSYQIEFRPGSGQNYIYQYYPDKSNAAAAQPVSVTSGHATSSVNAPLATGATVSGHVTDAAGAASGVYVTVYDYGGGEPTVYSTGTTTDASGNWSIDALPTGTYEVFFRAPNGSVDASQYYNDVSGQDPPTPITLTAGSTTSNIDATLITGGQISGTVTDGMTNGPAAGVHVVAVDAADDDYADATTDSQGHYTLNGLNPSASYRVEFVPAQGSALASEFYPSGATPEAATPVPVTVGQTTPNIDQTLSEGGSISGVVTDAATGYPIGNAPVTLTDDSGQPVSNAFDVSTKDDGTYDFTNLPPGSYKVQFSSAGALAFQYYNDASTLGVATSVNLSPGQAITNIDAALTEGGTLEGTVTDPSTGQGVPGAYVDVLDANDNLLAYGFTDPNGHYEIPGIAPGSYYVEAVGLNGNVIGRSSASIQVGFYGGAATLAGATPVTITAGGTAAGIDIVLQSRSATPPNGSTPPLPPATITPPTPTPTPKPPVAEEIQTIPGPPTLSAGSVSGLGKGKPVVKFRLRSGSNRAPKLRSFKLRLPAGLKFVAKQLAKGVKVTGGGRVTEKVTGGQLLVTLGSPASAVMVSISAPALKVTGQLEAKAANKRAGTLRVSVTVTPANGVGHTLSFTVKNPA
jgi:5-hydroxyisourate hydrolase-like protein (transthyretin family)